MFTLVFRRRCCLSDNDCFYFRVTFCLYQKFLLFVLSKGRSTHTLCSYKSKSALGLAQAKTDTKDEAAAVNPPLLTAATASAAAAAPAAAAPAAAAFVPVPDCLAVCSFAFVFVARFRTARDWFAN